MTRLLYFTITFGALLALAIGGRILSVPKALFWRRPALRLRAA
jgi:hypothetical protein